MSGGIAVRGLECDVGVMASVYGCTGCSGAVGPARIEGRRAIGCNCWWLLPASSACGRCDQGTNVRRARRGPCYGCWGCCRFDPIDEVRGLFYRRGRDSVRTMVGPRLAMSGVLVKLEVAWKSGSMPVQAW
jgi:hypothetical protein